MPVRELKNGMALEPNYVYVIPSNFSMWILDGVLNLTPRAEPRGQTLVIDLFFQSLAEDQKNLAIGVVLSGTGSDGTQGLLAIKAAGGITMAQTPSTAKFEGMPTSASTYGFVDLILSPEEIAVELGRIAHHPFVRQEFAGETSDRESEASDPKDGLGQIFLLLRTHCHVDFTF